MIDARFLAHLEADEGSRFKVYDDATGKFIVPGTHVVGHPTIGTGRCLDTNGISNAEKNLLFSNDVKEALRGLGRFPWFNDLDEVRRYVVLNMAFNMGVPGLLKFSGMIAALVRRDFETAAREMLDSKWRGQVPRRAERLARAMRWGVL